MSNLGMGGLVEQETELTWLVIYIMELAVQLSLLTSFLLVLQFSLFIILNLRFKAISSSVLQSAPESVL